MLLRWIVFLPVGFSLGGSCLSLCKPVLRTIDTVTCCTFKNFMASVTCGIFEVSVASVIFGIFKEQNVSPVSILHLHSSVFLSHDHILVHPATSQVRISEI